MKKLLLLVAMSALLYACQRTPGEVMNKVMIDFGVKQKPEGYVTGSDKVFEQLNTVGATEIKRLNLAEKQGKIKFQQEGELRGKYYKEVKVYESYYPVDAQAVSRSATEGDRGYYGYIDYAYRMYQSERKSTNAEAAAETAEIPTETTGRETYRYNFNGGGQWDGGKGDKSKR